MWEYRSKPSSFLTPSLQLPSWLILTLFTEWIASHGFSRYLFILPVKSVFFSNRATSCLPHNLSAFFWNFCHNVKLSLLKKGSSTPKSKFLRRTSKRLLLKYHLLAEETRITVSDGFGRQLNRKKKIKTGLTPDQISIKCAFTFIVLAHANKIRFRRRG